MHEGAVIGILHESCSPADVWSLVITATKVCIQPVMDEDSEGQALWKGWGIGEMDFT